MDDYVNVTRCIPRRLCIENVRCSPADDSTRVVDRSCVVVATAVCETPARTNWNANLEAATSWLSELPAVSVQVDFRCIFFEFFHFFPLWSVTSFFKRKKILATIYNSRIFSHYFIRHTFRILIMAPCFSIINLTSKLNIVLFKMNSGRNVMSYNYFLFIVDFIIT